jgi:DNA-binding response OmpR family regulator
MRVLLVEDSKDLMTLFARKLSSAGWMVRGAETVDGALTELDNDSFDMIVSDIGLPDRSGLELIREVREREGASGKTLSVAVTTYEPDEIDSIASGFDVHITKPVTPAQLLLKLEAIAERA